MNIDSFNRKLNKKLNREFNGKFKAELKDKIIRVTGKSDDWNEIIKACQMCVYRKDGIHVVNDIEFTGDVIPEMKKPAVEDKSLDGEKCDVLIIGGGISGTSIARELSKWNLKIFLVEKEVDVALGASGRNDGEVHPGVDLHKGYLKTKYIRKGNHKYDQISKELGVPFRRIGQYVGFTKGYLRPLVWLYAMYKKYIVGIEDTEIVGKDVIEKKEPALNKDFKFALSNPSTGVVCPYGLTIAYAENAVENGAKVFLSTYVKDINVENKIIKSVETNRGTIYPKIVINAAGVFAEEIAKMAEDRFYSIHPRRGTDIILDKKTGLRFDTVSTVKEIELKNKSHSKGGGLIKTAHDNVLVGPDAVETYKKEDYQTTPESMDTLYNKQQITMPSLSRSEAITYFTGVRAPNFEEDFVIEKGRNTKNLIHCAAIQSPGLTTAPAVALDIEKMTIELLKESGEVIEKNENYNPVRKHQIPQMSELPAEEREKYIKENPDYGIIICRCEQVSKGEILDALNAPISVPTVDGIKKRVRPGMGRCQGGFCMPTVTKIISDYLNEPMMNVRKSGADSVLVYGETKGGEINEN
ncbi:MAG: NAD(P)/FAD-dependent oxidoreductase [Clostridia bacterium]|nr:NAD(P)/FAD-dependent oxidoreductase [Clostridia bacterium]